jgi:hypothetical protein
VCMPPICFTAALINFGLLVLGYTVANPMANFKWHIPELPNDCQMAVPLP